MRKKSDSAVDNDQDTDQDKARRIRILRFFVLGLVVVLAISLAATIYYGLASPLLVFISLLIGAAYMGATLFFQDRVREWHRRYSIIIVVLGIIALETSGAWGGNFLLNKYWSCPAAFGLGFLLVMLPRFDAQMQRLVESRKRDEEAVREFIAAGDSQDLARFRLQAVKMGLVSLLLLIAMTIGLAAFGLYAAFTGDLGGIALILLWAPFSIGLIWLLRLRKQAGALREKARPA